MSSLKTENSLTANDTIFLIQYLKISMFNFLVLQTTSAVGASTLQGVNPNTQKKKIILSSQLTQPLEILSTSYE